MSLHLWSWVAIGLQFVLTILFGTIAQTRLGNPLRKVLFGLAIVLLAHTVISYFAAHIAKPFVIHGQNADCMWAIYSLVFGFLSWTAFCGSWLLASCQLTDRGLLLVHRSLVYRLFEKSDGSLPVEQNICLLTWREGGLSFITIMIGLMISDVTLLVGMVGFLFAGKRLLYPLCYFVSDVFEMLPAPEMKWPAVRLRGIRLIPILLPFYPIWGLAKGIVWLLGLIPKCLPSRKPLEPLELHLFTAMQAAESTGIGTTDLKFTPAQPSWFKRHLLRPAGQSLRWLWQLLVAVKRGACPRIELEDS